MSLASKLAKLYEILYVELTKEIDTIIDEKITDVIRIEECLERILNIPTEKGCQLLIRLCTYYMNINEEHAKFYIQEYNELYGIKPVKKRTLSPE